MKKYLKVACILAGAVISTDVLAAGCVNNGGIRHVTMTAQVGGHKQPSRLKERDEVGRFSFTPDSQSSIAECSGNASVNAYATYGEGSGIMAKYYGDIDGKPAFYTSGGYGMLDYAYVLYDKKTGRAFSSRPGAEVSVPDGALYPLDAELIIYAAKDNPTKFGYGDIIGAVLLVPFSTGGGTTQNGFSYKIKGNFEQSAAACDISSNDALQVNLPPISTKQLLESNPKSGDYSYGTINVDCNGDNVSAKIKLQNASSGFASYNGKNIIIKGDNLGQSGQAVGAGFIVYMEHKGGWDDVIEDKWYELNDFHSDTNDINLFTYYGRYQNEVEAGEVKATVQYVLEFD